LAIEIAAECAMRRGHLERAVELRRQMLSLARQAHARDDVLNCHNALGDLMRQKDQLTAAREHYVEGLRLSRLGGSKFRVPILLNLGLTELARGEFDIAQGWIKQGLAGAEDSGRKMMIFYGRVVRLPCLAHAEEWSRVDSELDFIEQTLDAHPFFDPDLAWSLELTFDQCTQAGRPELAGRAGHASLEQWRTLGRQAEIHRIEQKLDCAKTSAAEAPPGGASAQRDIVVDG